jgi:hypothetical protein
MKRTMWVKTLLIALPILQALNLGLINDEWSRKVFSGINEVEAPDLKQ